MFVEAPLFNGVGLFLCPCFAPAVEGAVVAFGSAGAAGFSAVVDEEVAEVAGFFEGDAFEELFFDFDGVVLVGEAQFAGDAAYVGIDDHAYGGVPDFAEDYVGGFSADARDFDELGHCIGDLAVVVGEDFDGGALEGFGFVAVETGAVDGFLDFFDGGVGEVLGGWELLEERWGYFVDSGVGALGGQDRCYQELPGVFVD